MNACHLPLTIAYHLPALKAEQLSIIDALADEYILINLEDHTTPLQQAVSFLAPDFLLIQPPQLSLYQCTFGLLQQIRATPKLATKCIVFLSSEGNHQLFNSLDLSGLLPTSFSLQDLRSCLQQLQQGLRYVSITLTTLDNCSETLNYLAKLTSREREVIGLIGWGESNQEIASKLSISVKTVENHKLRIVQKLSLPSARKLRQIAVKILDRIG
ncbi:MULTISPECIES: LuxR C-terminal-related transcriptional regulator [unclassified Siphonobacter]|uniref:LuxR family transcriptional regulator n=1 Tax=unclassified Siphonobacter TaxID=2635712 RepID=UPI000CB2D6DC|nr:MULTISPECIES: LuxR C-terminal-related transcriptional regulator [unclassified Siphonobacter]MDQ1089137.1 DNA-binding NarL/FixJ family response regulator [Siphonobacter sp. SORGH_AS_1065]MDR6195319.1 DNA-binding NarL/FixJ family response regulator [Siphonobacter sp. SORGH_AS_0500]PKK38231.1 hypothetical protein BWI96_00070 [Siphonobacter sp. SORGH_AS_0500]